MKIYLIMKIHGENAEELIIAFKDKNTAEQFVEASQITTANPLYIKELGCVE